MYAGGHCSILPGVFHGTAGWSDCEGCCDWNEAYLAARCVRRRHCNCDCGRVRSNAGESRGGGIVCDVLGLLL